MSNYNLEAFSSVQDPAVLLQDSTLKSLWNLFVNICKFWNNVDDPELMKSNFKVFISNRIEMDPNYLNEYKNAENVINELISELGEGEAYKKLFTDAAANKFPPTTRLARARQLVSNEFVTIQMALGGFKAFGSPLNYPGYFGGTNKKDNPPYLTYNEEYES